MSPRSVANFLKSKFGLFVVFVLVLFSGLGIYGKQQADARQASKLAAQNPRKVEVGQVRLPLNKGLESGVPQQVRPSTGPQDEQSPTSPEIVPFRQSPPPPAPPPVPVPVSPSVTVAPKAEPKPKKIRYASLLASYEVIPAKVERAVPTAPEKFMPFGTLLKCKLVNTVDSANLETPVIALLLEDVWQNGKKVVPANTLLHGTARAGRMRDRVTATGTWRLVWQDGRELTFNGVALDREYDHDIDGYGITDGSGGIKGRLVATDDLQDLKMLASAALSGFARGTQERTQTALGTTLTGSVSNGVREGLGDVFELYAQRTLKDIEENGTFVRVAAGKEFYVYVLEPVDPQKASVAGIKLRTAPSRTESEAGQSISNPTKG
jgi:hypothetical protein